MVHQVLNWGDLQTGQSTLSAAWRSSLDPGLQQPGAVAFFIVVRGGVALIVGPGFGETMPAQPIYIGAATLDME